MFSCTEEPEVRNYVFGTFPSIPVNMEDFNSEYDDYNSTFPFVGKAVPLCFSSNRNNQGANYDIVFKAFYITFWLTDGRLEYWEETSNEYYKKNYNLHFALQKINTPSDELGPLLVPMGLKKAAGTTSSIGYESYIFLFSNNQSGNQDINFVHNLDYREEYTSAKAVEYLNSSYDDAYPAFNRDYSSLYFCSNREGSFNIYRVDLDKKKKMLEKLEDTTAKTVVKDSVLSSAFDDKCPYIDRNTMVFASDRPGGYGGFDLYCSWFENGTWTEPVNLGSKINSAYDEFRPVLKILDDFTNDLMIFSSNRPGGKGGFDLYFVGIEKARENTPGYYYTE